MTFKEWWSYVKEDKIGLSFAIAALVCLVLWAVLKLWL